MGANYSHNARGNIKLTPEIYNVDHQNHIDNAVPPIIAGYSTSVAQMRQNTSPGTVGVESLATSLAGELERIRYMIKLITGMTQWYETPAATLQSPFPSGTRMPFAQAAAPSGWTQDVTDTANDRMLHCVSGVGGGAGGGVHSPVLNNLVPSHFHGFVTGTESVFHTHGVVDPGHSHLYTYPDAASAVFAAAGAGGLGAATHVTSVDSAGITLQNQSLLHTHSGSTDLGSSQTNWSPRYLNMIICSRN